MTQQRAANFRAGGVSVGVEDAIAAVGSFAGEHQLTVFAIEAGAPAEKLFDAQRAFFDENAGGFAVDEAISGIDGVVKVQRDVFFAAHGDGDSALGVVGVRFAESFLGHDQDSGFTSSKADGGAQTRDPCADDDEVCFVLRHELSGYRIGCSSRTFGRKRRGRRVRPRNRLRPAR